MTMYGAQLVEMAQVAEQEHMLENVMSRSRAQQRRVARRHLGPGRVSRAWSAFWAPRDVVLIYRRAGDGAPADLPQGADC
jgi:hypothetical protein